MICFGYRALIINRAISDVGVVELVEEFATTTNVRRVDDGEREPVRDET